MNANNKEKRIGWRGATWFTKEQEPIKICGRDTLRYLFTRSVIGLMILLLSGCGSLLWRSELGGGEPAIYPGPRFDVAVIMYNEDLADTLIAKPLAVLDTPLSIVFDTLLLPYDGYRMFRK